MNLSANRSSTPHTMNPAIAANLVEGGGDAVNFSANMLSAPPPPHDTDIT